MEQNVMDSNKLLRKYFNVDYLNCRRKPLDEILRSTSPEEMFKELSFLISGIRRGEIENPLSLSDSQVLKSLKKLGEEYLLRRANCEGIRKLLSFAKTADVETGVTEDGIFWLKYEWTTPSGERRAAVFIPYEQFQLFGKKFLERQREAMRRYQGEEDQDRYVAEWLSSLGNIPAGLSSYYFVSRNDLVGTIVFDEDNGLKMPGYLVAVKEPTKRGEKYKFVPFTTPPQPGDKIVAIKPRKPGLLEYGKAFTNLVKDIFATQWRKAGEGIYKLRKMRGY